MSLDVLVARDNRTETMSREMPLSSFSLQQQQEGRVHYDVRSSPDSVVCYAPVAVFDNQSLAKRIGTPNYASKRIIKAREKGLGTYTDMSEVGTKKNYILIPEGKEVIVSSRLKLKKEEYQLVEMVAEKDIRNYFVERTVNIFDPEMRKRILEKTSRVSLNGTTYYLKEQLDKHIRVEERSQYVVKEQDQKRRTLQVALLDSGTLAEKLNLSFIRAQHIVMGAKKKFISYEGKTRTNVKKTILLVPSGAEKQVHRLLRLEKEDYVTLELLAEQEMQEPLGEAPQITVNGVSYSITRIKASPPPSEEVAVKEFEGIVRSIAHSLYNKFPSSAYDVSDLMSAGTIGLLKAVRKYDPSKGASLKHWIRLSVKGYILNEIRLLHFNKTYNPLSRYVPYVQNKLGQELKREPTVREIAEKAGIEIEGCLFYLQRRRFVSLDSPIPGGPEKGSYHDIMYDGDAQLPDAQGEGGHDAEKLRNAISQLSEREQQILKAFYFEEQTSNDIGKKIGLSGARVRQIKDEAVDELRKRINPKLRKVNAVRRTSLSALLQ